MPAAKIAIQSPEIEAAANALVRYVIRHHAKLSEADAAHLTKVSTLSRRLAHATGEAMFRSMGSRRAQPVVKAR